MTLFCYTEEISNVDKLKDLCKMWPFNLSKSILPMNPYGILVSEFENTIIDVLEERSAVILLSRYKIGLSIEEISIKYGISKESIASNINRSIRYLKHTEILSKFIAVSKEDLQNHMNEMKNIKRYNEKLIDALKSKNHNFIESPPISEYVNLISTNMKSYIRIALYNSNIKTLGELSELTVKEFKSIYGIGNKAYEECVCILKKYGLKFKEE